MSKPTKHAPDAGPVEPVATPAASHLLSRLFRPPTRSDVPPELPVKEGEEPTEEQKARVVREAVNHYLRTSLRAPDVRAICEAFVAGIDAAMGGGAPLPDVPGVSISPVGVQVPYMGGGGTIFVVITSPGVSGTWTVTKDASADWLTFTPTTPQSTDGEVQYTAAANDGDARSANLYINGKTFAVDQVELPPILRGSKKP
jgi:hypothetical protein